jgi:two-component system chemotaxis response regulator CheY
MSASLKVLVVEAETLFRRLIKLRLDSAGGFEVSEAVSRTEMFDRLSEALPDVIVLGVKIADSGGLVLLRQLREHPVSKDIPVVFCVDRVNHPAIEEALEAGAADFIARPHMDKLLVNRILGAGHAASQVAAPSLVIVGAEPAPLPDRTKQTPQPAVSADSPRQTARILVVEDTPIMRRILVRALTKEPNFEIMEAETGADAMRIMGEQRLSLVLLDINLPDIGGLELLQQIKENPASAAIPVIMCTARRDREAIERAIALGATGYIAKPVEMRGMLQKVKAALGMSSPEE